MPKGIYKTPTGKYKAVLWEKTTGKHYNVGTYDTVREAAYRRKVARDGHHWYGLEPDPANMWGFVYLMRNAKTKQLYIGRKQFRLWNGPRGGYKCTDVTDTFWFDESLWVPNAWEVYTSSSDEIAEVVEKEGAWAFDYMIISVANNKLDLHIAEVLEQRKRKVLDKMHPDGDKYLYYNKNIATQEYRAPFMKADMLLCKLETEDKINITIKKAEDHREAMKMYYLRPDICDKCGKVVPYGKLVKKGDTYKCSCQNLVLKT